MEFTDIFIYLQNADTFVRVVLFITVIMYNFYALALAFQIFTYNRLMTMAGFAPVFRTVAAIHVAISFILLLLIIFSL